MSFSRGRYGVEYHPSAGAETHRLRGLACTVLALAAAAFIWYKIAHRTPSAPRPKHPVRTLEPSPAAATQPSGTARPAEAKVGSAESRTPAVTNAAARAVPPPADGRKKVVLPPPTPTPTVAPSVRPLIQQLEATKDQRPHQDQIIIARYADAERREDAALAIDAIRKLCDRPTMADLRDPLVRRLGDLNMALLLSGKSTPWTAVVTVRRGDGRERIAREHRTTAAAVERLNPLVKWEKLKPGDTVRVLEFPNACLVVHKQLGYADLSLRNGQLFRRYTFSISKSAKCDVYPIDPESGATVHARFRELGIRPSPSDRAELEMFLATGSRITVSEH